MGIDNVKDPEKETYASPPQMSEKTALKNETKAQEANLATSELQAKADPNGDSPGSPMTAQPADAGTMSMEDKYMALEKAVSVLANQMAEMQKAWDMMVQDPDVESADAGLTQAAQYAKDEPVDKTMEETSDKQPATPKQEDMAMEAKHAKSIQKLEEEVKGLKTELAQFRNTGIKKTAQSMSMKVVDATEEAVDSYFKKMNI